MTASVARLVVLLLAFAWFTTLLVPTPAPGQPLLQDSAFTSDSTSTSTTSATYSRRDADAARSTPRRSLGVVRLVSGYRLAAKPATTFIGGSNGVVVSTSRSRLEGSLSGLPSRATTGGPGREYTLPDGLLVRVMEPSGQAPLRASFTNSNGGPINPFTGKPVQPPSGLSKAERLQYIRDRTHVELGP